MSMTFSQIGRRLMRAPSRLVILVAGVSLLSAIYASASHLTSTSNTLGSGQAAVSQCMTGSSMTVTYDLYTTGNIASLVVGNISSNCAQGSTDSGMLKVVLAGSGGSSLATLGPTAVSTCALSGTYTCDLPVTATVAATSVVHNYAVITGP